MSGSPRGEAPRKRIESPGHAPQNPSRPPAGAGRGDPRLGAGPQLDPGRRGGVENPPGLRPHQHLEPARRRDESGRFPRRYPQAGGDRRQALRVGARTVDRPRAAEGQRHRRQSHSSRKPHGRRPYRSRAVDAGSLRRGDRGRKDVGPRHDRHEGDRHVVPLRLPHAAPAEGAADARRASCSSCPTKRLAGRWARRGCAPTTTTSSTPST